MKKELGLNLDQLVIKCRGRNGGLREHAPQGDSAREGLTQYVWRMCRFQSGVDVRSPHMAVYDLQYYLNARLLNARVTGSNNRLGRDILAFLEQVVDYVLYALSKLPGPLIVDGIEWRRSVPARVDEEVVAAAVARAKAM